MTRGYWIAGPLCRQISSTLAVASQRVSHLRANQGRLSELSLHYYQAQLERGESGHVVNVDIDLVSRRWVGSRVELMAWEFKPGWTGRVTSGQQSVLNELAMTIDLGVRAGLYDDRWSGVWLAVMTADGDPSEEGWISRVIPPGPIDGYREDRPTVVSAPVPIRMVDLLAILKHGVRPRALLEAIESQRPVLIAELMRQPR